jgi:hypothetical protein
MIEAQGPPPAMVVVVEQSEEREQEPPAVEISIRESKRPGIVDITSLLGSPKVTIVRSMLKVLDTRVVIEV